MQTEPGDDYIRRIAAFIRVNEKRLAQPIGARRRQQQQQSSTLFNPLGWFGLDASAGPSAPKPVVFSIDSHHLFYLLIRLEALGLNVGTLDVKIDSPSRPMSYINVTPTQDSDTISLSSIRSSLSAVSALSIGSAWWGRPEPASVDTELKYIFSSFTKLPALSISGPTRKVITELENEPPNENAIPLDAFKNVQTLECVNIDPRSILGWDMLAQSLRSLKITKSGLEDISDIFIGAVIDDQSRREGSATRLRRRRIPRRHPSFYYSATALPDSVPEEQPERETEDLSSRQQPALSSLKWAFLKHLSLSDNELTSIPSEPLAYLTSLTHLDLSSNLLVSVPEGLSVLHNLTSLNLSDNMIDSVLGIYLNLGQVLALNLSHNRLESICGLERLHALERVDLRGNLIEESAEVGRLSTLPNVAEVWIEGNPLCENEEGYRVTCFDFFWKEGKSILLDGTPPGFYERRNLTTLPSQQMASRPVSAAYSPPVVAVGHAHSHDAAPHSPPSVDNSISSSSNISSPLQSVSAVGVAKNPRKKRPKRIVDLDVGDESDNSNSTTHRRTRSDESNKAPPKKKNRDLSDARVVPRSLTQVLSESGTSEHLDSASTTERTPTQRCYRSRHSRSQTDYTQPLSSSVFTADITNSSDLPGSSETSVMTSFRCNGGSQTISSKSAARRARVTSSVYEPSMSAEAGGRISDGDSSKDGAEAFRRRIEALKRDMGDGWLKVFSQSQVKTPAPP